MEFKTEAHRVAYERTLGLAKEVFGETIFVIPDDPGFIVNEGSAQIMARVLPWGDDRAIFHAWSWVVTDIEYTAELGKWLLRKNVDFRFGALGIDDDDDIIFSQTVVADTLDKEELRATVFAVMGSADELDDEIVQRWGGRRGSDRRSK